MKKNKPISANEINKYVYCPYQWYYERIYGAGELRRLYKERNEAYGYDDTAKSNFNKGLQFHAGYLEKDKLRRSLTKALLLAFIILGALCGVIFYGRYLN